MKKFLMALVFIFIIANLSFATSSREDIEKDFQVYNSEINPKIVESLDKIEKEMAEIDNIMENKSKKDIKISMKIVENQVQAIERHMISQAPKIKTPEVRRYHDATLAYIKLRYEFLKEVTNTYIKNNGLSEKDKESLMKKYTPSFAKIDKETGEALDTLISIVNSTGSNNSINNNNSNHNSIYSKKR